MSGGTFSGTQIIENKEINGSVNIGSGARIILKNCRIIGNYGASGSGYTIKSTAGGGSWLTLEDCTVITRTGAGGNETLTKTLVSYGDCNVEARRCLFRGGVDSMYLGLGGEGLIPTGDPLVPMARALIEDSWIGEGERAPGAHADLIQIDGVDRGYIVVRGTRFMGYSLPQGSDTLTTRITDPETATMHSACFIVTFNSQGGTIDRADSHHIALRDNWFEGGNWVTDLGVSISPIEVTGNRYGLRCNFGMLKGEGISVKEDNRYGLSGETKRGGNVVTVSAGDLV